MVSLLWMLQHYTYRFQVPIEPGTPNQMGTTSAGNKGGAMTTPSTTNVDSSNKVCNDKTDNYMDVDAPIHRKHARGATRLYSMPQKQVTMTTMNAPTTSTIAAPSAQLPASVLAAISKAEASRSKRMPLTNRFVQRLRWILGMIEVGTVSSMCCSPLVV